MLTEVNQHEIASGDGFAIQITVCYYGVLRPSNTGDNSAKNESLGG
jgi:hypothetical protein